MTETTVAYHRDGYHRDGFGPGRPAINVKYHGRLWADTDYDRIMRRLAGNPAIGEAESERMAEQAYDQIAAAFWSDAADQAQWLGLGAIEQEGRSGGWLVLTDGRDPADPETFGFSVEGETGDEPWTRQEEQAIRAWLAAYRQMVEWCAERLAAVPGEMTAILEDMAADMAVAP